jgi:pimeloyl-ACP methyl ester carboxylesterase
MSSPDVSRDLVVVLPGIMGSTLARNGKLLWAPSAGSVLRAIATFGGSIRELTLPADVGDERPDDGVEPVALMPDLHLLPGIWSAHIGYGKLLDWLRTRFHLIEPSPEDPSRIPNLLAVPYDWRLSNRYNGRRLKEIVEPALGRWQSQGAPFSDAKIIFICHSMGGLVARWYIEKEGGAALTRKLVTLGTPYRGALNALDQLVNGVRKGIGPLKIDVTAFARSLPSIHQLLPEYACIESSGGLLKTTEITLPHVSSAMVSDAMRFHGEMDDAAQLNTTHVYDIHPIVGFRQRTYTTARIIDESLEPMETINGNDDGGDATVPRLSAIPKKERLDSPIIRYIADQHGSLQSNQAALDELEGVLTAQPVVYRAASEYQLGVRTEPLVLAGERVVVEASIAGGARIALRASVVDERGREVTTASLQPSGGVHRASIESLPAGAYRVVVGGVRSRTALVAPVTTTVLVWGQEAP